jgi:hypothetical protein
VVRLASRDEYSRHAIFITVVHGLSTPSNLAVVTPKECIVRDTNSSTSGAEPIGYVHRTTRTELLASGELVDVSLPALNAAESASAC